jgi:hypothetical protein
MHPLAAIVSEESQTDQPYGNQLLSKLVAWIPVSIYISTRVAAQTAIRPTNNFVHMKHV